MTFGVSLFASCALAFMKNESLRYPEQEPDPALFTLRSLYGIQPWLVLRDHLHHIHDLEVETDRLIKWHEIELLERQEGVEDLPDGFDDFHESLEDQPDRALQELISSHRDRMLTILSHYAVIAEVGQERLGR